MDCASRQDYSRIAVHPNIEFWVKIIFFAFYFCEVSYHVKCLGIIFGIKKRGPFGPHWFLFFAVFNCRAQNIAQNRAGIGLVREFFDRLFFQCHLQVTD